jgi:dinuclear metal center YbgI/SA1388 family protein
VTDRDAIVAYLDGELEVDQFRDYGPIGLQVVGAAEVSRVCVAVSASLDVFRRAAASGAQMLIVHHGLFWDGASAVIGPLERRRLQTLFDADITLLAYHLPLDAHPVLGNNARLAALLGIAAPMPFAEHRGRPIGCHGRLERPEGADSLAGRLGAALGSRPLVFSGGPDPVATVGVVSGGAARDVREAARLGLDAFVTGEPEEDTPYLAEELGVTTICAGHHATETVGVRAVAKRLEEVFGIETEYLPVSNPV